LGCRDVTAGMAKVCENSQKAPPASTVAATGGVAAGSAMCSRVAGQRAERIIAQGCDRRRFVELLVTRKVKTTLPPVSGTEVGATGLEDRDVRSTSL